MSLASLRLRNLLYHWRGNLAVLLGVVVGSAVLTGALLVGDSLRGSLRDLALRRLGWVEQALVAPRFFRTQLADELLADHGTSRIAPAILLQATARVTGPDGAQRQARGVTVVGVDQRFWPSEQSPSVRVNSTLGAELDIHAQEKISLRLQKPSLVPRESLLAAHDDSGVEDWVLTVAGVLDAADAADGFSLRPGVEAPRTVFVPLADLQKKLGQERHCNVLLAAGAQPGLGERLQDRLALEDWGLELRGPQKPLKKGDQMVRGPDSRVDALFTKSDRDHEDRPEPPRWRDELEPREWRKLLAGVVINAIGPQPTPGLPRAAIEAFYRKYRNYLVLESRSLLIEPAVGAAAQEAAGAAGLRPAPTLVYLANSITAGGATVPYSVVAALDPTMTPPLGPFLPAGVTKLDDGEIVLADWKESPLPPKLGEMVTLRYFPPVHHGDVKQQEQTATFRLAGFVPLEGPAADPDLTPKFPGITDQLTIQKWSPPFPYDPNRIKAGDRNERYWKEYRTTPKAYITLHRGQELWGSRFGKLTSIRLAAADGSDLAAAREKFESELLHRLPAQAGGFVFQPVRENALQAAGGGTDFGQLFLGFSFFLIAAALLLVGLLFRLNLERRAAEVGLLAAVGYRRTALYGLLLGEGGLLALVGALAGAGVAILYAGLLLWLLDKLWPGGGLGSFLEPHYRAASLAIGAGASFLVSVLTIAWAVRSLGKVPPRALLAGQTAAEANPGKPLYSRRGWVVAAIALVAAVGLLATSGLVHDHEMRAMTFFGSGSLLLTACLAAVLGWMRGARHWTVEGGGWWTIAQLGIRNAARHPGRSLLTTGLLASAAFLLVAVEAFRRSASGGEATAANGGCALLAESDLPLVLDLNTADGRQQVLGKLLPIFRDQLKGDNAAAQERVREAGELLRDVTVYSFRVQPGDDASCLNLYKPLQPRLVGVPQSLLDSGRHFHFAATQGADANPWAILNRDEQGVVPAFGEKNTVEWILKSGLGEEVTVAGGGRVRIEGLLQDSVFQSSLLVSEKELLRLYPGQEGFSLFLIATPAGKEAQVKRLLETALADRGFEATPVARRLESYLEVENTYLSTFQELGALGLVLGSLGLAVVLLRGVWERRAELALLRALGYRRGTLGLLVLAENAFLLLLGLVAGTASALVAVAPHLEAGAVPWRDLLALLGVVLVVGLCAGALATVSTLRAPLVPALRRE
jgi:ABC-type antimicrobial peptide transport system permease subunit